MKKTALFLILFTLIWPFSLSGFAQEDVEPAAIFFLEGGRVIRLDPEKTKLEKPFELVSRDPDNPFRMWWLEMTQKLKSIELINHLNHKLTYPNDKVLVTKQNGRQIAISNGSIQSGVTYINQIHFSVYSDVSERWGKHSIPVASVKKIVFASQILMRNPQTGSLFPPSYKFDPYTGAKLVKSSQ